MSQLDVTRILVYGVTGSGKTTLAAQISERTGIAWHSVDDLTWKPNWVQVPAEEQRAKITEVCAGDSWILDTAYGTWLDVPIGRAQLLVALDYPRTMSLGRLVKRTVRRLFDKRPICNGNRESLRTMFSRESIIVWHFKSFQRKHQRILAMEQNADGPKVIRFERQADVDRWLAGLGPR